MKSFAFRVRLHGRLSDADADRLYEGLGEEVAVDTPRQRHRGRADV